MNSFEVRFDKKRVRVVEGVVEGVVDEWFVDEGFVDEGFVV